MEGDMILLACRCCDNVTVVSKSNKIRDLKAKGWDTIFDLSKGLATMEVCPDCNKEIQSHVRAIENKLGVPIWKLQNELGRINYEL